MKIFLNLNPRVTPMPEAYPQSTCVANGQGGVGKTIAAAHGQGIALLGAGLDTATGVARDAVVVNGLKKPVSACVCLSAQERAILAIQRFLSGAWFNNAARQPTGRMTNSAAGNCLWQGLQGNERNHHFEMLKSEFPSFQL